METSNLTYLDHNATTPVRPQVREVMAVALSEVGNPSSVHSAGRKAYQHLSRARHYIANLVGCMPDQIIFTSGGTEANYLAIKGAIRGAKKSGISHIFVGATEHPCVLAAVEATGIPFDIIPVDSEGVVNLEVLEKQLAAQGGNCLICVMMANNETGAIQPVLDLAQLAERYEAIVHVDAVQAAGKLDMTMLGFGACSVGGAAKGVVSLSLSAHKMGGPSGVGALVLRDGHVISALFSGGGQEQGRRSGTQNMPGIAGFGVAAQKAEAVRVDDVSRIAGLRDKFEQELANLCADIVFFSKGTERLANTSCFAIPGFQSENMLINLDLEGICISSGSACSSGKITKSHVLRAMNVEDDLSQCALRVSLGWNSSEKDIEKCVQAFKKILTRTQTKQLKNEIA